MRIFLLATFACFFIAPAVVSAAGGIGHNVIYGDDDRRDLYDVKDPRILSLADSTVMLIMDDGITSGKLRTGPWGEGMGMCKDEPFYDQFSASPVCTGVLVGPDLVLTAGHCILSKSHCDQTRVVFGWSMLEKGKVSDVVAPDDLYGCAEILGRERDKHGPDWALIRLDRAVPNHKPVELHRGPELDNGVPLFIIGHPAGLPTKVAGGAHVRDNSSAGYFEANLDDAGGNSGSPVFNAQTLLLEGLLVRGETDYEYRGSCMVSKRCPNDGCLGEQVTRISIVAPKIPKTSEAPSQVQARRFESPAFDSLIEQAGRD